MRLGIALGKDDAARGEAIETLKRCIELGAEGIPEAFLHLASLYNKNRQFREAAEYVDAYLRAAPQSNQREYYEKLLKQLREKASQIQQDNNAALKL